MYKRQVQDSDVCLIDTELGKQYSDWSFPNLTLRSGRSTFQSMILMYDDRAHIDDHYGAGNPDYDKDDKLMFRDGGDGLSAINAKITINNPHYMMITAKSNAGISVEAMESWLRANVQWRSYDPTAKPAKITVYVDVENNLASKTNAVSRFFRSLLGAAPVIDAPGTVQENGTITFTSNAGYPAQWQMSELSLIHISPEDAQGVIAWTSSDEAVATVDAEGVVSAVGKGSCTIRAEAEGISAKTDVTVTVAPTGITLAQSSGIPVSYTHLDTAVCDVMLDYAFVNHEWDDGYGDWKWQKLTACAANYNYPYQAHNSLEDARATLYCARKVAESMVAINQAFQRMSDPAIQP